MEAEPRDEGGTLEQDKVEHIDKRTSERRDTVYVVLARVLPEGAEAWVEVDRVDALSRVQAAKKAHENREQTAGQPAAMLQQYKAVPLSSWKALEVGEEPQPPKAIVREVD